MRSFGKNTNAAILGFVAIALGIAMMLLFPNFFQIEVPDQFGWSMIIFLPTSSFYILRMLQSSKLMRHLPRYLTQP
jgi:cation-transporting ATPase E